MAERNIEMYNKNGLKPGVWYADDFRRFLTILSILNPNRMDARVTSSGK